MEAQTKICQNCKNQFTIEPDDFQFYEKIKVPPPTFCPECRTQRRLAWRSERALYPRKCDATGKDILAIYPPEKKLIVYDHKYWWGDDWDPMAYGRDYDFSRPFFEQFAELIAATPAISAFNGNSVNSDYSNAAINQKNCYLTSATWDGEDVLYSNRLAFCRDSSDLYHCHKNEGCYENVYCRNSYRLLYSQLCSDCSNSAFLYDCRNCQNCFGCVNLRNKSYCIFNQQYTKEEYEEKLKIIGPYNRANIESARRKLDELKFGGIHRYAQIYKSQNIIGDNIENARNCYWCFDLAGDVDNVKYSHWANYGLKDSYDSGPGAGGKSELTYEGVSTGVVDTRAKFTETVWNSHDVECSVNCHGCGDIFGCVSLKNKQYCVFNKQYSKEDYESLVAKIKEQMMKVPYRDKRGNEYHYGEFFPIELSMFAYNETVAQEYFPMSREEIKKAGYLWHEPIEKNYGVTKPAMDLPETIQAVTDSIIKEVIGCVHGGDCLDGCSTAFRIVPQELTFYRKYNLPLPRLCFNCRHYNRFKQRNPMKLWHRQCMCLAAEAPASPAKRGESAKEADYAVYKNSSKHSHHPTGRCPNEFETSYAPERKEIIYCEPCYQAEVI